MKNKSENSNKTLLFVDDEPDFRNALAFSFQRKGYRVLTAANGQEALKILQTVNVTAVVSDIRMPNGDGLELLENAKLKCPQTPIVLLVTGFAEVTTEEALTKGAGALLSKPFNISLLEEMLELLLTPEKQKEKAKLKVELSFQFAEAAVRSHAISIGKNGMFVTLNQQSCPNINDEVSFHIMIEEEKALSGSGVVRWIRTPPIADAESGLGVEFTYLRDEDREVLLAYLRAINDAPEA